MEITIPILNASALCCLDPFNLYALRHKSSTEMKITYSQN